MREGTSCLFLSCQAGVLLGGGVSLQRTPAGYRETVPTGVSIQGKLFRTQSQLHHPKLTDLLLVKNRVMLAYDEGPGSCFY